MSTAKTKKNIKEMFDRKGEKTVICAKRLFGKNGEQVINLEISDKFIVVLIKNLKTESTNQSKLYLYMFARRDQAIWAGDTLQGKGIKGKVISK